MFGSFISIAALRAMLSHCRRLHCLNYSDRSDSKSAALLAYAECDALIKVVELMSALVGDVAQYEAFFSRLRRVTLYLPFLLSPNAATAVSYMHSLEAVSIKCSGLVDEASMAAVSEVLHVLLSHASHISSVCFDAPRVCPARVTAALVQLVAHRAVRKLSVCTSDIDGRYYPLLDNFTAALASASQSSLTHLAVISWTVSDAHLVPIIQSSPQLVKARFNISRVLTDATILALAEHCPNLAEVHVDEATRVTEAALMQLVRRCRKLTLLSVTEAVVSQATADRLRSEARPYRLRVVRV